MNEIIKEHKMYKEQILIMAKTNLKKMYKGSFLGALWIAMKPAITIFVYWFTFAIRIKSIKRNIWNAIFLMANSRCSAMVLYARYVNTRYRMP